MEEIEQFLQDFFESSGIFLTNKPERERNRLVASGQWLMVGGQKTAGILRKLNYFSPKNKTNNQCAQEKPFLSGEGFLNFRYNRLPIGWR
ncbi:MAG: hypothetical protein J5526_05305 [Bacteroidales bacterium]|nr:hypothetical protein [Bacteroidales bacterium]